ncbi:amino acid permease [Phenylobacterium sp.]|uniref:amino acid permease n=1 Tax=Phenylobacterium sp. TaxID=1871053 RepID=UPI002734FD32|nr:amino acid permease [Phenylobacterium sp.]
MSQGRDGVAADAPSGPGVARGLGPFAATFLVAGNMIGSGVFLLPASLAAIGSASVIGWAVASVGGLVLALVFALLGIMRPDVNGLVRYPADGLHPAFGFLSWSAYWVAAWIGNVAIAIAAVGYLAVFLPGLIGPVATLTTTLVIIWLIAAANLWGPRVVVWLAASTLLIGLIPILAAIGLGVLRFDPEIFWGSWNVSGQPLSRVVPGSLVMIFWAFMGLESASVAAAAVDNPRRNLPIAALGGVALASLVYTTATAAVMGVIPAERLAASTAPFADMVAIAAGPIAGAVVAACALAKTLGTLGGWVLVAAEAGRVGAASGYLPKALSTPGLRTTPVRDILLVALLMSLATLATLSPTLTKQFNALINASVLLILGVYILCALALVRFASAIENPARRGAARLIGLAAAAFCVWMIVASL